MNNRSRLIFWLVAAAAAVLLFLRLGTPYLIDPDEARFARTTVEMTPTSGALAATNPKHSASALVTELPIIDGGVADLATISVTWPLSGPVTVTTS